MSAEKRPLYYLVTPAGMPNYGDELIIMTWLRHLAGVAPEADVVVDALRPESVRARMAGLHPRVRFTDTLWKLCLGSWSEDPGYAAEAVRKVVDEPERDAGRAGEIETLRSADVVHVVGGGYVNSIWPSFAGIPAGAAAAVRHSGGRAVLTGQGLCPPVADGGTLLRGLLAGFDVLDVRDEPSVKLLDLERVTRTGDDVLLAAGDDLHRRDEECPEVMVCVQSQLAEVEPEPLMTFLGQVLKAWRCDGVGLLECTPEEDREIVELAERRLPVARRYGVEEVLADGLPVRPGQTWLSTRFHPHLVAAAGGAGGIALNIRPDYYGTKHGSLIEDGSGWTLLSEPMIPARPASTGYGAERLAELRAAKRAVADAIYPARS